MLAASSKAASIPSDIASIPKFILALLLARSLMAFLRESGSLTISSSVSAQASAYGRISQPVLSSSGDETTVSVGPPLSQARTGSPHIIPSTGPMPKCSLEGVYNNARVDGDRSKADLCAVVKFSRNIISASEDEFAVESKGKTSETEGVIIQYERLDLLAKSTRFVNVSILSCNLGS